MRQARLSCGAARAVGGIQARRRPSRADVLGDLGLRPWLELLLAEAVVLCVQVADDDEPRPSDEEGRAVDEQEGLGRLAARGVGELVRLAGAHDEEGDEKREADGDAEVLGQHERRWREAEREEEERDDVRPRTADDKGEGRLPTRAEATRPSERGESGQREPRWRGRRRGRWRGRRRGGGGEEAEGRRPGAAGGQPLARAPAPCQRAL